MNAHNYVEWCEVAGLYLGNESHFARYRDYAEKISAAGLNTVIVYDFLQDNTEGIDLPSWRSYNVYELTGQANNRVERTANALAAIGAARLAERVRNSENTSPLARIMDMDLSDPASLKNALGRIKLPELMQDLQANIAKAMPEALPPGFFQPAATESAEVDSDCETKEQVQSLLDAYVADNSDQLQADIDRLGDPRTEPGYTREAHNQELQRRYRLKLIQGSQREDVDKLASYMQQIEQRLAKGKPPDRLSSLRRKLQDCVRQHSAYAEDESTPEMKMKLAEAKSFMQQHDKVFYPQPVADAALLKRLRSFGEYRLEKTGAMNCIFWDAPTGFECAWARFELLLTYSSEQETGMGTGLDMAERISAQFPLSSERWRAEVISCFREREGWMEDWELEDFELDDDGRVTDASVLRDVSGGTLHIILDDEMDTPYVEVHLGVEWESEHGLELTWVDASEADTSASIEFDGGSTRVCDAGPPLTSDQLAEFETQFTVTLPDHYRQFLLAYNGGVPEPSHLKLGNPPIPIDIVRFFSLTENSVGESSLQTMTRAMREKSVPPMLLPIGHVNVISPMPLGVEPGLFLVLEGARSGEIVLLTPDLMGAQFPPGVDAAAIPGFADMLLMPATTVATSMSGLFAKLKARPEKDVPSWLKIIRAGDTEGFISWLQSDGSLNESFKDYGQPISITALDYLAKEAPIPLLESLIEAGSLKADEVFQSWQRFSMMDAGRFRELMNVLPHRLWNRVLVVPTVWNDAELLNELEDAAVDFNAPIDDEGATPIHFAVQAGRKDAVKWLMERGADPHKADRYQRDAFLWAEHGPGFECLPILLGKDENGPPRPPHPDASGIGLLWEAAQQLPSGHDLLVSIQIKASPVTSVEKAYYDECHYLLSIELLGRKVTYKDMHTPRQDYLFAAAWPSYLFAPILQWPDLTPLWETTHVQEIDWQAALKKRNYQAVSCDDLLAAARSALEQAFDAEEAAAREVRLRK